MQRNSKQRRIILDALRARFDHPTADMIYLDVKKKVNKISRGTVYRNLALLSQNGEITRVKVPTADRYDLKKERHYHILCTLCGKVEDLPIEYCADYDAKAEAATGYKISRHRVIFEGLCKDCSEQKEKGN